MFCYQISISYVSIARASIARETVRKDFATIRAEAAASSGTGSLTRSLIRAAPFQRLR